MNNPSNRVEDAKLDDAFEFPYAGSFKWRATDDWWGRVAFLQILNDSPYATGAKKV